MQEELEWVSHLNIPITLQASEVSLLPPPLCWGEHDYVHVIIQNPNLCNYLIFIQTDLKDSVSPRVFAESLSKEKREGELTQSYLFNPLKPWIKINAHS